MGERSNPNNCASCRHKQNPDGGHCYMFRFEPTEMCAQHTSQIHALQALSAAPAPAPAIGDELRDTLVAVSAAIAERDDRAAQKMICEILAASTTPPAEQAAQGGKT